MSDGTNNDEKSTSFGEWTLKDFLEWAAWMRLPMAEKFAILRGEPR